MHNEIISGSSMILKVKERNLTQALLHLIKQEIYEKMWIVDMAHKVILEEHPCIYTDIANEGRWEYNILVRK